MSNGFLRSLIVKVAEAVEGFHNEDYGSFAISLLVSTLLRSEKSVLAYLMNDVVGFVKRVSKRNVRVTLWGDCGARLAREGKVAEAEEAFRMALEDLKNMEEGNVGQVLPKLAVRMAEAAATSGQKKFVDMIFEGLAYADAFSRMAAVGAATVGLRLLRSEEFEGAFNMLIDVSERYGVPGRCVEVLVEVARWLVKIGEYNGGLMLLEEALKWARREFRDERDRLLMKVAEGFLWAAEAAGSVENVDKAWMVAFEIEEPYRRAWVEGDTVRVLASLKGERGERGLEKAKVMAERIGEKMVKAWTMRDVAALLFEDGLVEDAVEVLRKAVDVARSILSDRERLPVLKDIIVDLAKIGGKTGNERLVEEALMLSEEVKGDVRYYSFTLQKIVVEMLRVKGVDASHLTRVLSVLGMMEPSFQELAVCDVLKFVEDERKELDKVINFILRWAEEVKDPFYRACIRERVAESLLKAGRVEEAASLIREIREEAERLEEPMRSSLIGGCSLVLAMIAAAGRGDWQEALACLERHADTSRKLDFAIQIAGRMLDAGEYDAAGKVMDELEVKVDALNPIPRYLLGRELALLLLYAGFKLKKEDLINRAVRLVRCAEGVDKRAEFLQELVERAIEVADSM
ncbi:MAG: hypothetical protein QXW47_11835 [Candidatus Jordarchaeales archaeon]